MGSLKKRLLFGVVLAVLALGGCKALEEKEAPSDHTINKGGHYHKTGLYDPETNCTGCHGSSLQGDGEAPSCYSCHGQRW